MTAQRCASVVLAAGTAALIACGGQEAQRGPDRPDAQLQPERAGEELPRREGADAQRRRRETAGRTDL